MCSLLHPKVPVTGTNNYITEYRISNSFKNILSLSWFFIGIAKACLKYLVDTQLRYQLG